MYSAIVGAKSRVVIPRKIRAMFHPPSPEALLRRSEAPASQRRAPPLGGEEGEARVLLRSRADKATAKQNMASERFRPTGVQEGATGLPVGLHIKQGTRVHFAARHGEIVLTPLTPRYFETMAGFLGTGGKALKLLLKERQKEREL